MKKTAIGFYKKYSFKEYVLVLKYFMKNKEIAHISGLCDGQFLNAQISEEALSDLFRSAYRHDLLVKQGEDIHINSEVFTFMNAWAHSVNIVSLHKPSFGEMKLIAVAHVKGMFLATVQNADKDSIILMADANIENLYAALEEYITAKDVNKAFKLKNINKNLQQNGLDKAYTVDHVFQLVALNVENSTGQKLDNELMFNVGKNEYEVIHGSIEDSPIEKKELSCFQEELIQFIVENCPEPEDTEDGGQAESKKKFDDAEPYSPLSYHKLIHTEGFPLSLTGLLKAQVKSVGKTLLDWKRLLKVLGINVLFSVLVLLWNMYGMCYLNDTFRISARAFWGSATAYLFAGTVGGNSAVKGLTMFRSTMDTVLLASSFYFLLAIAGKTFFHDIRHHDFGKNVKKIVTFPSQIKLYQSKVTKSIRFYLWIGIIIASVLGMLIFNPFTVLLLAIMLLVSCAKCEAGMISPLIMMYRTSAGYKKVLLGKKKIPLYADVQLWLFALGMGLLVYSGVNFLVWFVFSYNIWARLIFTVLLILMALFRLGIIKISKPRQLASILIVAVAAGGLMWLAQNGIVLADDGGWSESGGSIWGLIHNTGFDTILAFSTVLALATFVGLCTAGVVLPVTAGITAVVGAGALGWATFNEKGKKTANDFILGDYSPYGGDSKIATGLSIAVGLVPGVGEVFGICSGVRDASYDFSNGNIVAGIFDVACLGLNIKGLKGGVTTAAKGVANFGEKFVLDQGIKKGTKQFLNQMDDAARAAAGAADDAARATAGVADAATGIVMTPEQARVWNSTVGNKFGRFIANYKLIKPLRKQIVKTLTGQATAQIKEEAFKHVTEGLVDSAKQYVLGEGADFIDEYGADVISGEMSLQDVGEIIKDAAEDQIKGIVEIMNSGIVSMDSQVDSLIQDINDYRLANPNTDLTKDIVLKLVENKDK